MFRRKHIATKRSLDDHLVAMVTRPTRCKEWNRMQGAQQQAARRATVATHLFFVVVDHESRKSWRRHEFFFVGFHHRHSHLVTPIRGRFSAGVDRAPAADAGSWKRCSRSAVVVITRGNRQRRLVRSSSMPTAAGRGCRCRGAVIVVAVIVVAVIVVIIMVAAVVIVIVVVAAATTSVC